MSGIIKELRPVSDGGIFYRAIIHQYTTPRIDQSGPFFLPFFFYLGRVAPKIT